jgi:hypothetical protein
VEGAGAKHPSHSNKAVWGYLCYFWSAFKDLGLVDLSGRWTEVQVFLVCGFERIPYMSLGTKVWSYLIDMFKWFLIWFGCKDLAPMT